MGRKNQRTVIIVLAVVAVSLALATAAGVGVVAFVTTNAKQPAAKTYDREELQTKLVGKTEQDVLTLLGKPEYTTSNTGGGTSWVYSNISRDKISGQIDGTTFVSFKSGRVDQIWHTRH